MSNIFSNKYKNYLKKFFIGDSTNVLSDYVCSFIPVADMVRGVQHSSREDKAPMLATMIGYGKYFAGVTLLGMSVFNANKINMTTAKTIEAQHNVKVDKVNGIALTETLTDNNGKQYSLDIITSLNNKVTPEIPNNSFGMFQYNIDETLATDLITMLKGKVSIGTDVKNPANWDMAFYQSFFTKIQNIVNDSTTESNLTIYSSEKQKIDFAKIYGLSNTYIENGKINFKVLSSDGNNLVSTTISQKLTNETKKNPAAVINNFAEGKNDVKIESSSTFNMKEFLNNLDFDKFSSKIANKQKLSLQDNSKDMHL